VITLTEKATKIYVRGTDFDELTSISDLLKFRPPDYWRSDYYVLWKSTRGLKGWDGYTKPLRRSGKLTAFCMRGKKDDLLSACEQLGVNVDKSGLLKSPFSTIELEDVPPNILNSEFELDDNQRKVIMLWLRHAMGNVKASVSSGKTAMNCGAAKMIKDRFPKARFLYLAPTERLVSQVYVEAKKFLPDWDISKYGGNTKNPDGKDMVVATSAMIRANFMSLLQSGWFKTFMCLHLDESHRSVSATYEKIIGEVPAFFRFGASDTAKEDDVVAKNKITELCGPTLCEVSAAPLIQIGRIAKPHVYLVDIPEWNNRFATVEHKPEAGSPAWALLDGKWVKGTYLSPVYKQDEYGDDVVDRDGDKTNIVGYHLLDVDGVETAVESKWCLLDRTYDKSIIRFKERNELIVQWARWFTSQGKNTIVVCTRTVHVYILQSLLEKVIDPQMMRILYSEHSPKERDNTFAWFKETPGALMVTPLVKEGVSIPEARAGIVADHVVDWEVGNQVLGRFIRKKKDGQNIAEIVWFMDRQHPRMRRNSTALFASLSKIRGYTFRHPVSTPELLNQSLLFEEKL